MTHVTIQTLITTDCVLLLYLVILPVSCIRSGGGSMALY